jgi:hypothetical protein
VNKQRKMEVITEGHPDDIRDNNAAIKAAHTLIDSFVEKYRNELEMLILTYADSDAEKALSELREKFWTGVPL